MDRRLDRLFRNALTWLLLLALPLQGFAAASMVNCGPNHHRMLAASAGVSAPTHDHAVSAHHQHEAGDAHAAQRDAAGAAGHAQSAVHDLDKVAKFKCSACAACCMGAALPAAGLVIASFPAAMTTAVFVCTPHVDFLSDALDRPPRLLLV